MELSAVALDKPEDINLIFGQAHFIKTVEDIHEAIISASPASASASPSASRPVTGSSSTPATTRS